MPRRSLHRVVLLALVVVAGMASCGPLAGSPVELPQGLEARSWGDGPYGLVLVHDGGRDAASWSAQAEAFAECGMTVLAVEEVGADAVVVAIAWLRGAGLERVALLGAGDGAVPAMAVGAEHPELVDQLIVLSAGGEVAELGDFPKLFVASQGEPGAVDAERMAAEAKGDWNALFLAPGDATGQAIFSGEGGPATLEAVLRRLEERR
jgi:pimeloyl-ACP methyl ester carboxylesterase